MAALWRAKGTQFFDNSGNPLNGGYFEFKDAGTTSTKTVYQDSSAAVPWDAGDITLDSSGRLEESIYVTSGAFKEILYTSADVALYTTDNIPGETVLTVDEFARPNMPVLSKSVSYTVLEDDIGSMIQADATGGDVTITLISAVTAGNGAQVGVQNVGTAGRVIVAVPGGQTVNGASTVQLLKPRSGGVFTSNAGSWSGPVSDAPFTTLSKTTTYTVDAADYGRTIKADATGGGFTVTLPPAADVGDGFWTRVVKIDASTNLVTIDGDSAETINGAANVTISLRWASLTVRSDGTNWQVTDAAGQPPFQSATDNTLVRAHETRGALQTTGIVVDDSNNVSGVGTLGLTGAITQTSVTGANQGPVGTTAQRPSAAAGLVRYNSTLSCLEYSTASGWIAIPASRLASAWINFNGTGTPTARDSYNVASITDNSAGNYTINFTTALVDDDYAVSVTVGPGNGSTTVYTIDAQTTAGFTISIAQSGTGPVDREIVHCIVFGGD